jgi:hypothetical protein
VDGLPSGAVGERVCTFACLTCFRVRVSKPLESSNIHKICRIVRAADERTRSKLCLVNEQ